MNETLLSAAYHQLCENLLAIRRSGEWQSAGYVTFESYASKVWSLSKTRAKLFCDFAKFASMCRNARMPMPSSPDNVQPILRLAQKRWLDIWRYCCDCSEGRINAEHCRATMERFGFVANKRIPQPVLDARRARRAGDAISQIDDAESVKNPGPNWNGETLEKAARLYESSVNR